MRDQPSITLYGAPTSGNCHKVAQMLGLCGERAYYRFVNIRAGAQHEPDFRAISPFGEVPALVDRTGDSDVRLHQSPLILRYLADKLGLFGAQDEANWLRIESWLYFDQNRIMPFIAIKRYLMRFTPEAGNDQVYAFLTAQSERTLRELERSLKDSDFLAGPEPTIADIACSAYLLLADEADIEISKWPAVADWLRRMQDLEGWTKPYDLIGLEDAEI